MNRREHWNRVYRDKPADRVSWYQQQPAASLELIAASGIARDAGIIDVGGGASVLVDALLDQGYTGLAVLDVAHSALEAVRARLGDRAALVEWFEADVTRFEPTRRYALWHDRAVFHFLTDADERAAYVRTLGKALQPGGTVIIATFAPDGPPKCSGLDVVRYDERSLAAELGTSFQLRDSRREAHVTPGGMTQPFCYFRFERVAG